MLSWNDPALTGALFVLLAVLAAVLPFLPAEALAVCSAVAKEWAAPDALWKDRVAREFGVVVASGPWRRRYLDLRESQLLEEAGTYAGLC